jgi:hypothetical protein
MEKNRLSLSKQYVHHRLHGQPPTPEQALAFFDEFLPWKPVHDEILRGLGVLPTGGRVHVIYDEHEAETAANAYAAEGGPMERWFEEHAYDYSDLSEDELWKKFNWHYLNFLIDRRPDVAPCYAAQYTSKDGTEKQFRDKPTDLAQQKEYIPTSRAFLFEAGWQWQAVMLPLTQVSENGMDPDLAFELLLRIAEKADLRPERQARLGAFIRDRLRQYPDVNQTKLGQAVGLYQDQVRRLAAKTLATDTATGNARARREIEALILALHQEAAKLR